MSTVNIQNWRRAFATCPGTTCNLGTFHNSMHASFLRNRCDSGNRSREFERRCHWSRAWILLVVTLGFGFGRCFASDLSPIDYAWPEPPAVNAHSLHILTPNLLELKLINTKEQDPASVTNWNFVQNGTFHAPSPKQFTVRAKGKPLKVDSVYFKRRPFYGPIYPRDLRIENSLYLLLNGSVPEGQFVEVRNPGGQLWPASMVFTNSATPLRYSPAIHINQEGYIPSHPKKAMVGYYAGDFGEVPMPASAGFKLVKADSGQVVYSGPLVARKDVGYTYSPTPYQGVYEADFSAFTTPGEYRLMVPTLGASLSFLIDDGIALSFVRAYALGLYHQRCGTGLTLPYTRFTHDACHTARAAVPTHAGAPFAFSWNTISNYAVRANPDNPVQTAPPLTGPDAQLFPFVNQGPAVDVSGGHHDSGDYSKYTINSAHLIHQLVFAADSLAGFGTLDNFGIPESGDGVPDLMQEAKWEADFLTKMQDADGGFYFLVYPMNREYENNVTPENGDPQVVWPKTSVSTAAATAALAQLGSSPVFKTHYPQAAALYLQAAARGWAFLTNAIEVHGKDGIYQKITHYGDNFGDRDELAWAACQMFLATGDQDAHQRLLLWFDPASPATWRWGWWRMSECYGHAIRGYVFAAQSGRLVSTDGLDASMLNKCRTQIAAAGQDALQWSRNNAYGTSFPNPTKAFRAAGWYLSTDQAFDMAVAHQLEPRAEYVDAMASNMNYEGGCNPVNVCYVTGLGWRRTRNIVSQWAANDHRALPPSGLPVGNIQQQTYNLWTYNTDFEALVYPSGSASTAPYPFYDRWGDIWNVQTEMVNLNSARALGTLGVLATSPSSATQLWQSRQAQIATPAAAAVGVPVALTLQAPPGMDLSAGRFTWEGRDQAPSYGRIFTFTPVNPGTQWVEAEVHLPDGRRVFAHGAFNAN